MSALTVSNVSKKADICAIPDQTMSSPCGNCGKGIKAGGILMSQNDPLLKIRFDGTAVGPGKIPVSYLLSFFDCFNKVLKRTGRVLHGEANSVREGPVPKEITEEVEFDLVQLTHGSPATIIGLDRSNKNPFFPGMDFGSKILEKVLDGLEVIGSGKTDGELPPGYDRGVLEAWRDAESLFGKGIDTIQFTLNNRTNPLEVTLTPTYLTQIRGRILGSETSMRTVEGRLLMADFKEDGTKCRIHPPIGKPVSCLFDEEQKEEVLTNILRHVRIKGEADEDPVSKEIKSIKIRGIESLEDILTRSTQTSSSSVQVTESFWESNTVEELALLQDVKPIEDIRILFGTWPGEENDGFEETIEKLRNKSTNKKQ